MATGNGPMQSRRNTAAFAAATAILAVLTMPVQSAPEVCTPDSIDWIHQFGTTTFDDAWGVAGDAGGNVYVVGRTDGTLPGQIPAGGLDAFVRKYDPVHNVAWTRQFGTAGDDWAFDVAVDAVGNVYVAGSIATAFGRLAFLRKYDQTGTELWRREFGGPVGDARGVAVDAVGGVYVTGGVFGAPFGQSSAGSFDAYVRKYDETGAVIWTSQFGTTGLDQGASVAVDAAGNVTVAGYVGTILPGQSSAGGLDIFVRQYDSSHAVVWTRQFGTSGDDTATGVAIDDTGNTYVTGGVAGALPGQISQGGVFDAFLRKYDGAGGEVWTRQFGTPTGCPGCFGFDLAWSVALDDAGNAYVSGEVGGPLPGQTYAGGGDAFVRSYDLAGNERFIRQFGSTFSDSVRDVASVPGSVFLAGDTFGVLEGENPGFNWDAFVARLFIRDVEPPKLSIVVSPDTLWPPDHRMVQVTAAISVSDACDSNPIVTLVSVTSNEPDNGESDGNTTNDIQIVDLNTLMLRAERSGEGSGRIYTATYVATDAAGNASAPVSMTVTVPVTN